MSMQMEKILNKLGWKDGFQIPIANSENQALEEELAKLMLQKERAKNLNDSIKTRLEAIQNHKKFVIQENEQNQKLLTAHKQQFDSEEHQYKLSQADKHKVEHDLRELTKRMNDLNERQDVKKDLLHLNLVKVDKLKVETKWDEEALAAWEEAIKKRDGDNELIKKFSKEDESKFNEMEAKRKMFQVEYESKVKAVAKITSDCHNYEMIIERTGKILKQQAIEKEALINQWKETVKILQQRDNDISKAQTQLVDNQDLIQKQLEILEEQNNFLRNEQKNNHDLELEMQDINTTYSRIRKDLVELKQHTILLANELLTSKRTLANVACHLENQRIKNKQIKKNLESKENSYNLLIGKIDRLKERLRNIEEKTITASERVKHLEHMIDNEQKQEGVHFAEAEKLQKVIYRTQVQLQEQRETGKLLQVEITSCISSIHQLKRHIKEAKAKSDKLKEVLNDLEYEIDSLEHKLEDFEQEKSNINTEEQEKRVVELELSVTELTEVRLLLQDQLTRIQEEMQRLNNAIAAEKQRLETLKEKLENGIMEYEMGLKQLATAKDSTQEKQVEENLIRLRLNNIEKDIKGEDDKIFSLQKMELSLEQAVQERQLEINTTKDILLAKRRHLDEDRGRLKADIVIRLRKIEQFKKKYHIALMTLGTDADGQQLSISHFKIQTAQEKFFLQQEGDKLDSKIKTAEQEIVAMENTLKVVNLTNSAFKQSLGPVLDTDKEANEMKELEKQLKNARCELMENKKELNEKKPRLLELQNLLKEAEECRDEVKNLMDNLNEEYEMVKKQEISKDEKLHRAKCQLKKVSKLIKKDSVAKFDRDFEIRQLRDSNKAVLQKLVDMSMTYAEVEPLITRYSLEYKIPLPEKKWTPSTSTESTLSSPSACSGLSSSRSSSSQNSNISTVVLSLKM